MLAYAAEVPPSSLDYTTSSIVVAQADAPPNIGQDGRRLTPPGADAQPDWSPDGSTIVFDRSEGKLSQLLPSGTVSQLYVVPANGGDARPLSPSNTYDVSPRWLDAGTIVFAADVVVNGRDKSSRAMLVDADGSNRRPYDGSLPSPDHTQSATVDASGSVYVSDANGRNRRLVYRGFAGSFAGVSDWGVVPDLASLKPLPTCPSYGTNGRDTLVGTSSADDLEGLGGNDTIYGGAGDDFLSGGAGNDRLQGGAGADQIVGGAGNDLILARDGERDSISCGSGRDTVVADRLDRIAKDCEHVRRS